MAGSMENGRLPITGFAKIEEAKAGDITFIANPKYAHFINTTSATAVLVADGFETEGPVSPTLSSVFRIHTWLLPTCLTLSRPASRARGGGTALLHCGGG